MLKKMNEILAERNLNYRQQCGLQPGWGGREPSILDLSPDALALCRKNPFSYGKKLFSVGNILFPAADISEPYAMPAPVFPKGTPASVPEGNAFYSKLALKMGFTVISDSSPLPENEPVVIFGNSAENKHACRLAIVQKVLANGVFPGPGGWSLEFPYGKILRAVISCDEESCKDFLAHWEKERTPRFQPGPQVLGSFASPEELLMKQVTMRPEPETIDEFVKRVVAAFDSGGPGVGRDNGHCTVPPMVRSFYAYCYSGDRRFLYAFKEILAGMIQYHLAIPGGASYLSDYDFYLGSLLNCFAAAERDPVFTEEDRLLTVNFLLSSFRLIEKFGKDHWPMLECALRFNHETFPAINCYWAARYFGEVYDLKADAARWKTYAKTAFSGGELSRTWRQNENSGNYQWIVPSQKLQWDLAEKGKPSPAFKKMAEAIKVITDNDGRQIGYGDSDALTGNGHRDMLQALAQVSGDELARELSDRLYYNDASPLPVLWGFYLHLPPLPRGKMESDHWKMQPLVSHIYKRYPEAKLSKVDKAVYRDENTYLLFEPSSCDLHRHNDTGAVLAYQYGKHLWLVDNGYGYDARNTSINMVNAWASREVGPHCHNMIILRDKDGKAIPPPSFPRFRHSGDTLYCQMTFAGVRWERELHRLEKGLHIIDKVTKVEDGEAVTVECQFNGLGENLLRKNSWLLTQDEGGKAELSFRDSPGVKVSESSYLTKSWETAFRRTYFYAHGDVKQLRRTARLPEDGRELIFDSTFKVL